MSSPRNSRHLDEFERANKRDRSAFRKRLGLAVEDRLRSFTVGGVRYELESHKGNETGFVTGYDLRVADSSPKESRPFMSCSINFYPYFPHLKVVLVTAVFSPRAVAIPGFCDAAFAKVMEFLVLTYSGFVKLTVMVFGKASKEFQAVCDNLVRTKTGFVSWELWKVGHTSMYREYVAPGYYSEMERMEEADSDDEAGGVVDEHGRRVPLLGRRIRGDRE